MTIPSAEGFLQASSCLPGTATEEREVVDALTREAEKNVKHGDLRYLVSQRWCLPISPLLFPVVNCLHFSALNRLSVSGAPVPAVCIMRTEAI